MWSDFLMKYEATASAKALMQIIASHQLYRKNLLIASDSFTGRIFQNEIH